MKEQFRAFAHFMSDLVGSSGAFFLASAVVLAWVVTGPLFSFSDTWQLVINTGTTIVTFLMVFLIQNMQNRDARAIHLKLDELIRATSGARNGLLDLEHVPDDELEKLAEEFHRLRQLYDDTASHVSREAERRQKGGRHSRRSPK